MSKPKSVQTETIVGKGDPWFETGTEGVVWSVYDSTKKGYDGLYPLSNGQFLTVYDKEQPDKIVWSGNIKYEFKRNYRPYPMNPKYGQQEIFGYWVNGIQEDVEPETWAKWFFDRYPMSTIQTVRKPEK
jgi:hypothetical protein